MKRLERTKMESKKAGMSRVRSRGKRKGWVKK